MDRQLRISIAGRKLYIIYTYADICIDMNENKIWDVAIFVHKYWDTPWKSFQILKILTISLTVECAPCFNIEFIYLLFIIDQNYNIHIIYVVLTPLNVIDK